MNDQTVQRVGALLSRFGPYLSLVAVIVAVIGFLPGDDEGRQVSTDRNQFGDFEGDQARASGDELDPGSDSSVGGTGGRGAGAGGSTGSTGGGTSGGAGAAGGRQGSGSAPAPVEGAVANCDPNTGRIMIESLHAPPCVPAFSGDNGGATWQGVTADSIKLVYYKLQEDAASSAILTAAGANDSQEQEFQQARDWVEFYSTHYELHGRTIDLELVVGSGEATDDAAGRADAVKIAEEIGAFAVINAPNNAFAEEVTARGVMCFCTVSQPHHFYTDNAPFIWSSLMASTQGYIHRGDYVGRKLAGRKAVHAGTPILAQQERVFGLAYYDDAQQSYRSGVDFFVQYLSETYGISMAAIVGYQGYPDTAESQEAARPLIQKMKDAGVTSVLCSCDPFAPIFFTQEATRQQYFPEWIITGSALTDTSFFARLYDQTQWANAFGLSYLTARVPEELSESYHKYFWHFGKEPSAPAGYGIMDAPMSIFFNGVHVAGPNLNPGTFRDGMFRQPPAAVGRISLNAIDYGPAGELWPFDDYLAYDDITLIWWDPGARGEDELGNNGVGLYRYVDGGKRYLPGELPEGPPKAFQPEGTVTVYEQYPPGDAPPDYPSPG